MKTPDIEAGAISKRRQLSLAFIDEDIVRYLGAAKRDAIFELALRERISCPLGSGALLLSRDDGQVVFAARVVRKRRAGALRSVFEFEDFVPVFGLTVEQLRGQLLSSQQGALSEPGGALTDKAAERVTEFLQKKDPQLAEKISLWRHRRMVKPAGSSETIFEQRDATAMLFRMAGMHATLSSPDSRAWEIKEMQKTYLPSRPYEDVAILADAVSFMGWQRESVDGLGVEAFTDGAGSTLSIVNINRMPSETASGADLVYHHVQRKSFVHVQYKRMLREQAGSGTSWVYKEDRHFPDQLAKLGELDKRLSTMAHMGEYRLSPECGYFKFTMMDAYGPGDAALVPGQYLSGSLLRVMRGRSRGRKFRLRGDEGDVPYLTNTLFADLVGYGLIGSRGVGHSDMRTAIRSLAKTKGSVVVGVHSESVPTRRAREREVQSTESTSELAKLFANGMFSEHLPGLEGLI